MSAESRKFQFNRRDKSIADLSAKTPFNGKMNLAQIRASNLWKANNVHQIGIATSTEVGLEDARWPIRVRIAPPVEYISTVDTICHYWPVVNAAGEKIPFQPKAPVSENGITTLYKALPQLDDLMWVAWNRCKGHAVTTPVPAELVTLQEAIRAGVMVANPTVEQTTKLVNDLKRFLRDMSAQHRVVQIPISNDHFLRAEPHGRALVAHGTTPVEQVMGTETLLSAVCNYNRIKGRYPDISEGTLNMCAFAAANMFALGYYEQAGGAEYYTVYVNHTGNESYTVVGISSPPSAAPLSGLAINSNIDISQVKIDMEYCEISTAFITLAGVMHYSFNHTTGGPVLSGPLLSVALSFGLYDKDADQAVQEKITSVFYEALHPTNKRLIANMFFTKSGVVTAGRHSDAPIMVRVATDSFINIRQQPYPAGGHKAYVAAEVLKRILSAHLAPFLPWASEINNCVNACTSIINAGARAHIGSRYYTGDPPTTQGSNLDNYMPDLAAYINNMAKFDTLAMSPHLSMSVASKSNPSWVNLLKSIKSQDISGTSVEVVKRYLMSAGQVAFNMDPNDEETWAETQRVCTAAMQNLAASTRQG